MEQITINLLATGITPVCHVSQFDDGRTIRINLKKGAEVFTLSGTEEVKMRIRKPDNTERVVNITNTASSYVDYVSTPEDCDIEGVNVCELVVGEAGSKNFLMNVEEDAYGGGADIETLTASGPIATFETNMVDNLVDLKAEITPIQDLHGYDNPWPAGGGKNIACLSADKIDNSQRCNITYVDNNNIIVTATDSYGRAMFVVPCKPDTVYTVSFKGTSTGNYKRIFISPDNNWSGATAYGSLYLSATEELERSLTFTTVSDATYIYVGFYPTSSETSGEMTIKDFMIEQNSIKTSFAPYENICPITGHTEAKNVRAGKNLIKNIVAQGQSANHVLLGQSNSNTHETYLKRGVYTISYKTAASNIPSLYLKRIGVSQNVKLNNADTKATFIIEEDDFYRFWVYSGGGANASDVSEPQIELGSEVTEYEPYSGSEVTVQFGQTIYKGVLDAKNSKVILTSKGIKIQDKYWIYISSYNYFQTTVSDIERNTNASQVLEGLMCEAYANRTPQQAGSWNINGSIAGFNDAIRIKDLAYVNPTDFVNAMGDYLIVYPLAEPIEIPLSAISQFETLLGINNVYSDIGDVELKYLKQV